MTTTDRTNKLFAFTLRARRVAADGATEGALVPCYAADADYQAAIRKAIVQLKELGFAFETLEGKVQELDVADGTLWPAYVARVWPEFPDVLPPPESVPQIVRAGGVFFGPIAGFRR